MKWLRLISLMACWLAMAGCEKAVTSPPAATAAATESDGPTKAQGRLPTVKLFLGTSEMVTEIAVSDRELQTGMMFRTNMPEMEAMIFVFPEPFYRAFWMKNTLVPLSAAYVDPNGVILEIHDMQPKDTTSVPSSSDQVQYVLETNQGWFKRHNVGIGSIIKTEKGTLKDTFFRR